jgi:hypothetical protein
MDRTPESIRTKIVRVMQSYKKAQDRFNTSGNGLEGIEESDFHSKVLKETCRFYDDLKPILGDRPNVTAWATNEDEEEDDEVECLDDESDIEVCSEDELDSSNDEDVHNKASQNQRETATSLQIVDKATTSTSRNRDTSESSGRSDEDVVCLSPTKQKKSKTITQGQRKVGKKKQKIAPIDAKELQKSIQRKGGKSIHKKNNDSKLSDIIEGERLEREFMMSSRQKKMEFEEEKHNDLKQIEDTKMRIDEKRFELEQSTFVMKKEQIKFQTDYEKNRVLLQRIELFKKREELKVQNPNITDEFLDKHFPL